MAHPGDAVQPDQRQKLVDHPVGTEDLPPEHGHGDRRAEQRGEIEDGPIEADAADALVEGHGQRQRQGELQGHGPDHIGEGDVERRAEPGVEEEHVVVVEEADPARRLEQVELGEGEPERGQRGPERQAEEADEPGEEEEIAGAVALPGPAQAAGRPRTLRPPSPRTRGGRSPPWPAWPGAPAQARCRMAWACCMNLAAPSLTLTRPNATSG